MEQHVSNRWFVLAVLFAARVTMAFQFQAVAALSPVYMTAFGVELSDIGFLIGLYLAPGLIFALPGGAIGQRFGDRRVIAFGMVLMLIGAGIMVFAQSWEGQIAGRLVAGAGGVLLNVLMTKVVTDYFAGREIATAMGIFINSWPVGIAAALLILPVVAVAGGLTVALAAIAVSTACGLLLFVFATRETVAEATGASTPQRLRGVRLAATITAGGIWGLYNGALAMVFGFGPAMLVERGWSLAAASSTTSITLWLVAVSVPLGGFLADRLGHRDVVLLVGLVLFGLLLLVAPNTGNVHLVFILLGLCAGLPAGPIMALPSTVLGPGTRAAGMGVFFTLFYAGVVFAPVIAGHLADLAGSASAAFHFGSALLATCFVMVFVFRSLPKSTD